MAKEVVRAASVASHLVALTVVAVVMAAWAIVVDMSRELPITEVLQKTLMTQFFELKPSTFVGDGKPEMVE